MNGKSVVAAVVLLSLTLGGVYLVSARRLPIVVRTNLEGLPMVIGDYRGVEDRFPQAIYDELNADKHVYRHYKDSAGNQVSLYIGYYGTAKGGRTGHNPYACLPGAGWSILKTGMVEVPSPGEGAEGVQEKKVNYILATKDGVYETVLHWYQVDGDKVLATGFEQNLQRLWGRIIHNRNDGAFVRVTTSCDEENIDKAKQLTRQFAGKILALLPRYWPEEM